MLELEVYRSMLFNVGSHSINILLHRRSPWTRQNYGFSKPLTVSFLLDEKEMFATASTCDLQLRLPTRCVDYNSFADAMVLFLKGNDGFGGV